MRRWIPLTLVSTLLLTSCALRTSTPTTDANAATAQTPTAVPAGTSVEPVDESPVVQDLQSFHLDDPEAPKVAAPEFAEIPAEVNPMVDKWVNYFQGRGRRHMERYLARSSRYEKLMKKVLSENGVPEDLFYVALIESGFSSTAVSHASAVGYWQFIRGTGKRYGLEISKVVDERRDPVLATQAAADYFKGLYGMFGSWYLSMASYNVGENRVKKEIAKHDTRDFWELSRKSRLPVETLNYIPKFLAARMIAKNPAAYGFDEIDYLPAIEFDTITLDKPINLRVMAEKMSYNYEEFKALNPKFKGEIASLKKDKSMDLRIPVGTRDQAILAAAESVAESVEFIADVDTQAYKIRRGDNMGSIARKFRTSVAYLRDLNDMPRRKSLKVGSIIYVPDRTPLEARSGRVAKTRKMSPKSVAGEELSKGASKYHVVQSGDNLSTIARRYGASVSEISRINKLSRGGLIRVGMKLRIPGEGAEPKSSDSTAEKRNPSSSGNTKKKFAGKKGNEKTVKSARAEKSSKSASTKTASTKAKKEKVRVHIVRRGENLGGIAQKYQVNIADLKKKNRIRNPASIMAGARLLIPQAHAD